MDKSLDADVTTALALLPERPVNMMPAPVADLWEVANLMAQAGPLVGPSFQNEPKRCFAIAYQCAFWSKGGATFDPFAVSQKAYVTPVRGTPPSERINYEAQLVNALVNANADLTEPFTVSYTGEAGTRRCTVSAKIKGSNDPKEYQSPLLSQISPKNSPLWVSDPDQQLYYYSVRAWARRHKPQVLLGVYTNDEMPVAVRVLDEQRAAAADLYSDDAPPEPQDAHFEDAGTDGAEGTQTAATDAPGAAADGFPADDTPDQMAARSWGQSFLAELASITDPKEARKRYSETIKTRPWKELKRLLPAHHEDVKRQALDHVKRIVDAAEAAKPADTPPADHDPETGEVK